MIKTITAKKVAKILEDVFTLSVAEKWDKVGLQIGNKNKVVNNIVVAMDLTTDVMDFAIDCRADMIVLYHPFLFNENDFSSSGPKQKYKKKIYSRLKNSGMCVYSMHTAFDKEPLGMPLAIKRRFPKDTKVTSISGLNHGMIIEWKQTILDLDVFFQDEFHLYSSNTNVNSQIKEINKFALISGSASLEDMSTAWKNNEIDLIVTSDIKWADQVSLQEEGIHFMGISHYIEYVFINHIVTYIKENLNNLSVFPCKVRETIKNIL